MHAQWLDRLNTSITNALRVIERTANEQNTTWISLPQGRLRDATERINSLRAADMALKGRGARKSLQNEIGVPLFSSESDQARKYERYAQLNALRIAVIDLNEICEDLTQSYWLCALGFKAGSNTPSIIDMVISNKQLRARLKDSCGVLLEEGHTHLNKIRNAFAHFPYTEYESKIIDAESSMRPEFKSIYKLSQTPADYENRYYAGVFDPFCQLGARAGTNENDFSRTDRNKLNDCLFSAGRLVADMAEVFYTKISSLIPEVTPPDSGAPSSTS